MPDSTRPLFHFLPPANWLNDPNGLIQWQGRYHLFYQYNPHQAAWGNIHWGHADSADLVHWRHLPIALAPLPGGPDQGGIWSGCALGLEDRVAFLYTGVAPGPEGIFTQRPCLAWGDGELLELRRHPANPVIPHTPPGLVLNGFRDHTVWKEGPHWRMAIGSGLRATPAGQPGSGTALLYSSPDLVEWTYLGPLCSNSDLPPGTPGLGDMWECPSFIQVDGKQALIISSCGEGGSGTLILSGPYANGHLQPETVEKLDYGKFTFYAPQAFNDAAGRCLLFGWLQEARSPAAQLEAGWSGVMSLPRQIRYAADGLPRYRFVPELASLRQTSLSLPQGPLGAGLELFGSGRQVEILLELERGQSSRSGLVLLRSPAGEEETRLEADWEAGLLRLVRTASSLDPSVQQDELSAPLALEQGRLRLHLFLDGSTIEIIAAERVSLTGRVYPTRADSTGLGLFATGGPAQLVRLEMYTLATRPGQDPAQS